MTGFRVAMSVVPRIRRSTCWWRARLKGNVLRGEEQAEKCKGSGSRCRIGGGDKVNFSPYHYCPLDAFLGIIRDREIWLTNIFCMNDSAEHYWLRRVLRKMS